MKKIIAVSLASLLGASAFAGGGDLYATKGCQQEYNGYWGIGVGVNYDKNNFKLKEYDVDVTPPSYQFSAKETKSKALGHLFLGYSFYNSDAYSIAVESGMYTNGKEVSKTKVIMLNGAANSVVKGKAQREPAYYLAIKPRYNSGDWWINLTFGAAATSYRIKGYQYDATTLAGAIAANYDETLKDGFMTYGWMLGAGVGMYFTPNWALSLDYDYMNWKKKTSTTHGWYNPKGSLNNYDASGIKDGTASHFVTLNLKNNFNWFS